MLVHPGDAREGSDTPGRREPTEWETDRAEELGTVSARAHREGATVCGAVAVGVTPLVLGGAGANVTRRSAPHTKKDLTQDTTVDS